MAPLSQTLTLVAVFLAVGNCLPTSQPAENNPLAGSLSRRDSVTEPLTGPVRCGILGLIDPESEDVPEKRDVDLTRREAMPTAAEEPRSIFEDLATLTREEFEAALNALTQVTAPLNPNEEDPLVERNV
ncbi:MAG: hypothetical protein M1814_005023 [Vezdaea aestivalis]|nr:MAG: hypothetical protein M1814_005023 [Vezdaea aestivalis]